MNGHNLEFLKKKHINISAKICLFFSLGFLLIFYIFSLIYLINYSLAGELVRLFYFRLAFQSIICSIIIYLFFSLMKKDYKINKLAILLALVCLYEGILLIITRLSYKINLLSDLINLFFILGLLAFISLSWLVTILSQSSKSEN